MDGQKNHPIQGVMETTMNSIRDMVDVNTIIGTPITVTGGTVIIPVSKVGFGFASGGSDFATKNQKETASPNCFGGGSGAGVTITPVSFLVVSPDGKVQLLNVEHTPVGAVDKAVDLIPDLIDKFKAKGNSD